MMRVLITAAMVISLMGCESEDELSDEEQIEAEAKRIERDAEQAVTSFEASLETGNEATDAD